MEKTMELLASIFENKTVYGPILTILIAALIYNIVKSILYRIEDPKKYSGYDQAFVKFNDLSDELIASYVESGNGLDKAGGYGIQDGFDLVEKISGNYSCVVGLPMEKITPLLEELL